MRLGSVRELSMMWVDSYRDGFVSFCFASLGTKGWGKVVVVVIDLGRVREVEGVGRCKVEKRLRNMHGREEAEQHEREEVEQHSGELVGAPRRPFKGLRGRGVRNVGRVCKRVEGEAN
jgi:hypothetical protein